MLVLYGRLTFQPACVFRGLNKGLNCVCVVPRRYQATLGSAWSSSKTARRRSPGVLTVKEANNNINNTTAPALSVMPTLSPTAASAADADRAALHTTASGVPNQHVSLLRQWFCSCASTTITPAAERINWYYLRAVENYQWLAMHL